MVSSIRQTRCHYFLCGTAAWICCLRTRLHNRGEGGWILARELAVSGFINHAAQTAPNRAGLYFQDRKMIYAITMPILSTPEYFYYDEKEFGREAGFIFRRNKNLLAQEAASQNPVRIENRNGRIRRGKSIAGATRDSSIWK